MEREGVIEIGGGEGGGYRDWGWRGRGLVMGVEREGVIEIGGGEGGGYRDWGWRGRGL